MKVFKDFLYWAEDRRELRWLAFAIPAGATFWLLHTYFPQYILTMNSEMRQASFPAVASAATALLGFVITASAIMMTLRTDGSIALLAIEKKLSVIHRCFTTNIWLLSLCTVMSFVCIFLGDRIVRYPWMGEILMGIAVGTMCRMVTCVTILADIVQMHVNDIEDAAAKQQTP